ncbi:MAG: quinolinate synthase NadA [Verrucomicrobiae bacterium]|nr:quinolinate synthase NadA [Verrucomicrobiae bacterium]
MSTQTSPSPSLSLGATTVDCLNVRPGIPPQELSRLQTSILNLKKQKNAVILAHNYQLPEIQDVADFVGDSLGLSYQAAKTTANTIVFCGVHFMAETAKIINPSKKVLLPDLNAECSLSDTCPAEELAEYKRRHPDVYVIAYINCSAKVKAQADIICTSGNSLKIARQAPEDRPIVFLPDENLGQWTMEKTGRQMDIWHGACHVHFIFTSESLQRLKMKHPGAPVVAHPECTRAVRLLADHVCSTEAMLKFCREHPSTTIIVATESGMMHRLRKEIPGKTFIPAPTNSCSCNDCGFMKMNTLEKVEHCLETLTPEISLDPEIQRLAFVPIQRMLEASKA